MSAFELGGGADRDALVVVGRASVRRLSLDEALRAGRGAAAPGPELAAVRAAPAMEPLCRALAALAEGRALFPTHPRIADGRAAEIVAEARRHALPEGCAVVLATSGSTGEPKLCALSGGALVASARASRANVPLGPGDRWLLAMSFAHAGGLSILTRCLEAGAAIVALDTDAFSPELALAAIRDHGVTHLSVVPTMLAKLLEADAEDDLARVRAVLVGGAACPPALYDAARRRGAPLLATYGLTEAGSQVTTQRLDAPEVRTNRDVGVPIAGTFVSIEQGRVVVRGPTLMHGYLGRAPIEGVLVTEDAGALDGAGRLVILGRVDDMIITGGENVHPLEVERALLSMPGVTAALVLGLPDPTWGELVAALVVLSAGTQAADVAAIARERLPSFHVPRRFAVVDAIPVAPSGKPDRRAAKALLL